MKSVLFALLVFLFFGAPSWAFGQQKDENENNESSYETSMLTVFGRGEVSASPDQAVVRLGAVAQAAKAAAAQEQVGLVVDKVLKELKTLGIPEEKIATVDLSIMPIYAGPDQSSRKRPAEPAIVGYRAGYVVRVEVEDLKVLGKIVDAGLSAGANKVEGISFGLKDDREARRQALRLAAREARSKAENIAKAAGVQLAGVRSITEGGADLVRPQMGLGAAFSARETTVLPGQIWVEATLTISYDIVEPELPPADTSPVTSGVDCRRPLTR